MAITTSKFWEFADKNNQIITSHQHIELLRKSGFLFEACAIQSTVIEALLFFVILTRAIHRKEIESKQIRHGLSKLTIGRLITRSENFALIENGLLKKLRNFNIKRNLLFHHHLVELNDFDYNNYLFENEILIQNLFQTSRSEVYKEMKQSGHPDADKFK